MLHTLYGAKIPTQKPYVHRLTVVINTSIIIALATRNVDPIVNAHHAPIENAGLYMRRQRPHRRLLLAAAAAAPARVQAGCLGPVSSCRARVASIENVHSTWAAFAAQQVNLSINNLQRHARHALQHREVNTLYAATAAHSARIQTTNLAHTIPM